MSAVIAARLPRRARLFASVLLALLPSMASAQDATSTTADPAAMDHAAMGHGAVPAATPPPATAPVDHSTMDHSKMDHSTMQHGAGPSPMPPPAAVDHSTMDHSKMDHSTMQHVASPSPVPPPSAVDHSTMDHSKMDHSTMPHGAAPETSASPREPLTPIPPITAADRAAAAPPAHGMHGMHAMHDNAITSMLTLNRLETWDAEPGIGLEWEGQAWMGTDLDRLWLRSEGERIDGRTESADIEVLYGRSVARWWDVVAGVRHDFTPGASQDFAAIGLMGLAPQKFEVSATAYIGERGQTAARVEAEYELLLTNRLVLQPLVEANLYGQDDKRRGIGSGLNTVEVGARVRYEITRRFAPYVGVVRERAFGTAADLRRADGDDVDDTRVVVGVRAWF